MSHQELLASLYPQHFKVVSDKIYQVLKETQHQGVLIHSGEYRIKYLDDSAYPLKINPHFLHLLPLDHHPTCFVFLNQGDKPTLFYYQEITFWSKIAEDPQGYWTNHFNIQIIRSFDELKKIMVGKCQDSLYIGEFPEMMKDFGFKAINDEEYLKKMHIYRAFKTEYEHECLREATRIAVQGHKHAEQLFRKGNISELEIHLEYLKAVRNPEHRLPYDNIMAFNEASAILHYIDYRTSPFKPEELDSFLIDAGALYKGYASDITRTYSFRDEEFAELAKGIDDIKLKIIEELKHGFAYTENHIKAHHLIAQLLKDHHLIENLKPEDMVEKKLTHKFFPHGLGHFLGLQVHDVGGGKSRPPADHPYLRCTQDISEGHVFTIEPGIYFIDFLLKDLRESSDSQYINWNKVMRMKKFGGIRQEDNVIVHKDHFENITQNLWPM